MNFTPILIMLGISITLFFIGGLIPAKATPRENRAIQRTPRPRLEEWQEGNTVCYGVIYKGSKPIIPSPSERFDPTQRPKRLHFVSINGRQYEVKV